MPTMSTPNTQIARVAGAIYGWALGSSLMNACLTRADSLGFNAWIDEVVGRDFSTSTQIANAMAANALAGAPSATVTTASAWVKGQLDAAGQAAWGSTIARILADFSNNPDASVAAYSATFNSKIDNALLYADSHTANTTFDAIATTSTFTLTASTTDSIGGTGNGDYIDGNQVTFDATDSIDGGAGTDTLRITNTDANGGLTPALLTSVENIQFTSFGASSIDLVVATGVEKVISKNSTANDTFSNIQTAATVEVDGSSNAVVATFKNSLAGSTKTANVTLKGGATVSELDIAGASGAEFGTIAISSEGSSANTLTLIEDEGSAALAALSTVTVTGSAALTLGTSSAAFAAAGATISAGSATGNLTVNGTNFEAITLGSGDDTLYLSSSQVSGTSTPVTLNGGSGSNTLVFGAQDLSTSGLANSTAADDVITNFQTITFTATNVAGGSSVTRAIDSSATGISGVTTVVFDATNAETSATDNDTTVAITGLTAAQTVKGSFKASALSGADEVVTLAMASPTGSSDAVTFESVAGTNTAVNSISTLTVGQTTVDSVAQSVETLNVIASRADVSSAVGTTISAVNAGYTATLNVSGASNIAVSAVELDDSSTADATYAVVDASNLTGNLTLGTSGADFQTTDADDIRVTLGSGTNTVYGLAALDDGDRITGTTGTDTVALTGGSGAVYLSNIDTVNLTGAASSTTSAANWSNVGTLAIANNGESNTVTNLAAGQVITSDAIVSDTLTLNNASSTSLTVSLVGTTASSSAVLATNATSLTINDATTYSSSDASAIDNAITVGATPTTITLTGGGTTTGSTTALSTFALSTDSSALVRSVNSSYAGNLDVTGVYFDTAAGAPTVTTGSNTVAATTTATVAQVTNGAVHFNDTAGTDVLAVGTVTGNLGFVNIDGYETIALTAVTSGATTVNFRDASGYSTIKVVAGSAALDEDLTLNNVASGTTISLNGTLGDGSETVTIAAATGSSDTVTLTTASANFVSADAASIGLTTSGFETVNVAAGADDFDLVNSNYSATLTLTGATTVNFGGDLVNSSDDGVVTIGTVAATSATAVTVTAEGGNTTIADLGTMNSLETLTFASASGKTASLAALTSTSLDAITASGAGAVTISALTASSLDAISFGSVTGVVTLGSTSSSALTMATGATITTGSGNDVVTISSANLVNVDLSTGTDTLYVIGTQNGGTGVINLASSTDQISQFNGVAESNTQVGANNIDLTGVTSTGSYGFSITAAATGSTITGSAYNDTIILGAASDVVVFKASGGVDTVTGFTLSGTGLIDKINVDALTTSTGFDASLTTGTTAITTAANKIYLVTSATAGAADSTTGASSAINAAAAWTDTAATLYVVVVDNNSTGVFKWIAAGDGSESAAGELTLVGTIDAALVAGNVLFA